MLPLQTYTSLVTRNVIQRTTEVSYTPVVQTQQLTVTQTAVRVEQVPDIRYTTVERTRPVISTAYVTETKVRCRAAWGCGCGRAGCLGVSLCVGPGVTLPPQ